MYVPHSERAVFHLQINGLILLLSIVILTAVLALLLLFATRSAIDNRAIARDSASLAELEHSLDSLLGEVEELTRVYDQFDASFMEVVGDLSIEAARPEENSGSGDLASIAGLQELGSDSVTQIYDIRRLRDRLAQTVGPLGQIASLLEREKALLTEIPSLWPVLGGRNTVSQEYGPNVHPLRDQWYLNTGIDISGPAGLPIVASANGVIVEARLDSQMGLGNTVLIEHKYGFQTRYSHLGRLLVREGDQVAQGQQIGIMGSTGAAVRPHLSFQIMLGTEILDPNEFLKIRNDLNRWLELNRTSG